MKENKPLFGSKYFISETQNFLMAEMTIIRGIIKEEKLKDRALKISSIIFSLLSTGNAILLLSEENQRFYNECVMLARSFFERVTNICYLLLCEEETYKACMHHTIFRQYIKRNNSSKVMKDKQDKMLAKISLRWDGTKNAKKDEKLRKIIDGFKKQRKTKFPLPKIEKRLGFLNKYKKYINASLFLLYQQTYYDDASEALHGSFYGSLFHVLSSESKDKKNVEIDINKNTALLLLQTGGLIHQLISLLNKNNTLNEFYEKSAHNDEGIDKKLKFALEKEITI